jgi:hypothetical protein
LHMFLSFPSSLFRPRFSISRYDQTIDPRNSSISKKSLQCPLFYLTNPPLPTHSTYAPISSTKFIHSPKATFSVHPFQAFHPLFKLFDANP